MPGTNINETGMPGTNILMKLSQMSQSIWVGTFLEPKKPEDN
jgi:hypothetical protein